MLRQFKCSKLLIMLIHMNADFFYWNLHCSLTGDNDVLQDEIDIYIFFLTEDFWVSIVSFLQFHEVIQQNPILLPAKKRRSQTPIQLQFMIFLYKLSSSGSGVKFKRIRKHFKLSEGNARNCFESVLMEILYTSNY